jgi:hypothetical protein
MADRREDGGRGNPIVAGRRGGDGGVMAASMIKVEGDDNTF